MGFQEKPHSESIEASQENFPKISEGMVANMLQISLMPLAYQARHPEVRVDMKNPEFTQKEEVSSEWLEQDAKMFRAFIDENPDRTIDLSNEEELTQFLQEMWDSQTRH